SESSSDDSTVAYSKDTGGGEYAWPTEGGFISSTQCLLLYVLYPNVAPACLICILLLSAKHTLRRQYLLNRLQLNHHLKIQIGLVFQLLLLPLFLFLTYFLNLTNHHLSFLTCRLF